jgi:hypothetical protein
MMNIDWAVFLFGVVAFLIGSLGILAGYAGAAIEEAEQERGVLARVTLRICSALGILAPGEEPSEEERSSREGTKPARRSDETEPIRR